MYQPPFYPMSAMPEPGVGGAPELDGENATYFVRGM